MERSKKRSLKLGLMVAIGVILFSFAIYYLGSQQNLFTSTITLKSYFNNVSGLIEGNKVRYSGITVGYVSHIEIIEDTTVLVEMSVNEDISRFIRKDSKAEIANEGVMGSKILNIYPGSSTAEPIKNNDFIPSQQSLDVYAVLEDAQSIIRDGQLTVTNLLEISNKINGGEGDLARLLNDNSITTKLNLAGDEALSAAKNTSEIISKINAGEGDFGRLVNDTTLTSELNLIMENMQELTSKSSAAADQLLQFSKQINEGNGLINRLAYDTLMASKIDTTLANANRGIEKAASAAETLEKSWLLNLFSRKK